MSRAILAAPLALLALSGCTTLLWETGLPWTQADFTVTGVIQRGPFLDVRVAGGGIERRFFTRDSEECRSLLRTEATVTLRHTDGFGPFERGGVECPVVGISDLEKLRGSRSRGGGYGASPIRRGNDRIRIVHADEQYRYARGGFSIGAMFGWAPGTDQVVALLPQIEACEPLADGGLVGVLYRDVGSPALGIAVKDGVCPVEGLIAVRPEDFAGGE